MMLLPADTISHSTLYTFGYIKKNVISLLQNIMLQSYYPNREYELYFRRTFASRDFREVWTPNVKYKISISCFHKNEEITVWISYRNFN